MEYLQPEVAQSGEREHEALEVGGSSPSFWIFYFYAYSE